jgi:hypothetical protein
MSTIKQLEQLPVMESLTSEAAATYSGGAAYLYQHANFRGRRLTFFQGTSDLRRYNFNDQTSSIVITGNQRWAFYRDINFQGPAVVLGRGSYPLVSFAGLPNDWVSSLRRIA